MTLSQNGFIIVNFTGKKGPLIVTQASLSIKCKNRNQIIETTKQNRARHCKRFNSKRTLHIRLHKISKRNGSKT